LKDDQKSSKKDPITYPNEEDETSILTSIAQTNAQLLQSTPKKISDSITSSNTDINQTLFKIRTRG
jgi:hypothetical protein